jgi:uncharacterized protein (TIGR03437 family)
MTGKHLIISCLAGFSLFAQVSGPFPIGAIYVVHSATRRTAQTAESGLAPGSLCDINITGLYQPIGSLSPDETVMLVFRGPGAADARDMTIVAAQPNFTGFPTEFTALIPADAPLGQAEVLAVTTSGRSYSTSIWIAASGFGIFTKSGEGSDAAAAQVWRDTVRTVGLTTPVRAGEWVTLWGTGLGLTASTVLVEVAGIGVSASYAGPAPGFPGVDQINFRFPTGVPDDCYIPLTVKVDARESNTTSIGVASTAEACHHRLGLSPDALATLDKGGKVLLSQTWVQSDSLLNLSAPDTYRRHDTISLDFIQYDAAGVQEFTGLLTTKVPGCQLSLGLSQLVVRIFVPTAPRFDAGMPVVTGPGGVRITMAYAFGYYSTTPSDTRYTLDSLPPSSFAPGEWAVEAPGGNIVAAFRTAIRIPPALRWISRTTVSPVSRTSDLTLKWDPSGYTDQEWMQGSVGVSAGSVTCLAPASAGSVTIPTTLIAQLPVPANFPPIVQLQLTPANSNPAVYSAPLVGGGSIPGISTFSYLEQLRVELK